MKANISGVDIFAMVYSWSSRGLTYIVSTCGKTIRHKQDYYTKFSDNHDNTVTKPLPQPALVHVLFHVLPLLDEFNKERQHTLGLEKSWLTRNCWRRYITSLVGECVTDMVRWDRYKRCQKSIVFYEEALKDGVILGITTIR